MNRYDIACVLAAPPLWIGYGSAEASVLGGLMGFAAMFSTVYALMSLIGWGVQMVDR